jgi:excisionase family DNA binding protein
MSQKTLDAIDAVNKHYETLAEAAARVGLHPKTLRRRIADGSLTGYRAGPHLIRLDPAEVDALMRPIPSAKTA